MRQQLELTLEAIAHGGESIGRHGGKAIFVPYAIPGERVRVELVEERERWARGRLLEVLDPSPYRVEPLCPYFGPERCGGCQWQHIAYEFQAELKQQIVADQLRRLGHVARPPVSDIVVLADPAGSAPGEAFLDFGYRNHVQFACTSDGRLGYRRAESHDLIAVDHCPLLHPRLDQLHGALDIAWPELTGVSLRAGINTDQALILLESSATEPPELEMDLPASCALITPRGVQPLIGEPWIEEEVAGRRYRISAESFFQVNTVGAQALVDIVTAYAQVNSSQVLLDGYCGVGLFALALADSAGRVIGIESSPAACDDFAYNAGARSNVDLHEGPMAAVLQALGTQAQRIDVAVLDPPRAGAGADVVRGLAALAPQRIVYVSCDPATLARDAMALGEAGYRLVEVQPVDMFPQTYHVETVALWERG